MGFILFIQEIIRQSGNDSWQGVCGYDFFFSRRIFSTHLDEDMGEMKCGKLEQILMMMMNFIHYEEKGDMT